MPKTRSGKQSIVEGSADGSQEEVTVPVAHRRLKIRAVQEEGGGEEEEEENEDDDAAATTTPISSPTLAAIPAEDVADDDAAEEEDDAVEEEDDEGDRKSAAKETFAADDSTVKEDARRLADKYVFDLMDYQQEIIIATRELRDMNFGIHQVRATCAQETDYSHVY